MLQPDQFGKYYGAGLEGLFPEGSSGKTTPPFPAAGRQKGRSPYDQDLVNKTLQGTSPRTEQVDPRTVHSTQSSVTRQGVSHYMDPENQRKGTLFVDQHEPGNQYPIVYSRNEGPGREPTNMLLSGHHRATVALLQGRQFTAVRVEGGWGRDR